MAIALRLPVVGVASQVELLGGEQSRWPLLGGWSWLVLVLDETGRLFIWRPAGARKLLGDITDFVKFRYTPIIKRKKHSVGG